ncbi:TPA: hypothetical protein SIA35_004290 [Aeromonas sobria]|nr:hypothetical protein [Aeromonas sobria]
MKLLLVALLPSLLLGVESQAAIARNQSVSVNLDVFANVDIARPVSPGVSVTVNSTLVPLFWNATEKTFISPRFNYLIHLDASAGVAQQASYHVGLRDVHLNCATSTGNYQYSGIDNSRVSGFGNATVQWQKGGADATISAVGQSGDVKSPPGTMQAMFSPEFNRDVPGASGSVTFQFPLLTREVVDGGADCVGGALLMFYGEL